MMMASAGQKLRPDDQRVFVAKITRDVICNSQMVAVSKSTGGKKCKNDGHETKKKAARSSGSKKEVLDDEVDELFA